MKENQELVNAYLKHKNYKQISKAKDETIGPLLSVIIMDVCYDIYTKQVRPIESIHEMKLWKSRWKESYRLFNNDFFSALDIRLNNILTDKMDDFREYINNELTIAKVAMMDCFKDYPLDQQETMASILLCNTLTQAAEVVYSEAYRTTDRLQRKKNPHLAMIRKASYKIADLYRKDVCHRDDTISLRDSDRVDKAVTSLCSKMVKWLRVEEKS